MGVQDKRKVKKSRNKFFCFQAAIFK